MKSNLKKLSITLALVLSIFTGTLVLTGCPKPSDSELAKRVYKSFTRIPEVVRVVAPNANPTLFRLLDKGATAFNRVIDNPTQSNWQIAKDVWTNEIKSELQRLNNSVINGIVLAVDILLDQVVVGTESVGDPKVDIRFKESDVKSLERKINDALGK